MADLPTDTGILGILNNMCRQAASSSASSSVSAIEAEEELAAELHEDLVELQEDINKTKEKRIVLKSFLEDFEKEVDLTIAVTQKLQGLRNDILCFVPSNTSMFEQLGELREVVNKEKERRIVLQKSYEGLEKEVALTKDVTENLLGVVPRITSQIKSAKSAPSAASASHREGDREHKRRHGSKHLDQSRKRQRRQSGERRRY